MAYENILPNENHVGLTLLSQKRTKYAVLILWFIFIFNQNVCIMKALLKLGTASQVNNVVLVLLFNYTFIYRKEDFSTVINRQFQKLNTIIKYGV